MTPAGAATLARSGHTVLVERGAGAGCSFSDADYRTAGARVADVAEVWDSELVIKIKEPLDTEYRYLDGQIVFTYFHLAGVTELLPRPSSKVVQLRSLTKRSKTKQDVCRCSHQ